MGGLIGLQNFKKSKKNARKNPLIDPSDLNNTIFRLNASKFMVVGLFHGLISVHRTEHLLRNHHETATHTICSIKIAQSEKVGSFWTYSVFQVVYIANKPRTA